MIVYLTLLAAVLIIAYRMRRPVLSGARGQYGISRQQAFNAAGMLALFLLLFLVSALRLNVGNDYARYVEFMHLASVGAYVPTEAGFNLLTSAIYRLCGFENYLLVFAIFALVTILFFLAAMWQQSVDFAMTFFMFMTLGYYYQSLSTVRYYLALGAALFAIRYVLSGDWPRFLLLVLVGALFHKSMLVVLLLYPLCRIRWRKWMLGLMGAGCLSCLIPGLRSLYLKLVVFLYPSYADTEYLSGGTSLIGVLRCGAVLIFAALVLKDHLKEDGPARFYFHCNLLALLLYVFGGFLPVVSRIAYYLTISQILFVPLILMQMSRERTRKAVRLLILAACLFYFAVYMRGAGNDGVRILPYQTFLFHEMPPTLSEVGVH